MVVNIIKVLNSTVIGESRLTIFIPNVEKSKWYISISVENDTISQSLYYLSFALKHKICTFYTVQKPAFVLIHCPNLNYIGAKRPRVDVSTVPWRSFDKDTFEKYSIWQLSAHPTFPLHTRFRDFFAHTHFLSNYARTNLNHIHMSPTFWVSFQSWESALHVCCNQKCS